MIKYLNDIILSQKLTYLRAKLAKKKLDRSEQKHWVFAQLLKKV